MMINKVKNIIKKHKDLVEDFECTKLDLIIRISEVISRSIKQGGILYLCGNGGSAADAQHIAGEFIGRFKKNRKALPAIALTTDSSVLTCIGNDYGYDKIFLRQAEALLKKKDILWVFSTSGSSSNIISAAKIAKKKKATVITFTGKKGSKLGGISDICLTVNSSITSSIQEIHQIAYHIICELVEDRFI